MPELPEVEVQRRYVADTSLHKKVERVNILDTDVIRGVSSHEFKSGLEGATFEDVKRRGKFLEVSTDSRHDLVVHFGMTGHLEYVPTASAYEKYARVTFTFAGEYDLRYLAVRKLGGLYLVPHGNFSQIPTIRTMGPEPLSPLFGHPTFLQMIEGRSAMVKALLLDQSFIAGIGNVYGDEILFQAGIRPDRRASELDAPEVARLFKELTRVIKKAIHRKARLQGLEASFLALHRSAGERCPRCESRIDRVKVSGRTSYYCPRCQR